MVDTTVLITMVTGMARDKLRMRLLPQDQTLMLTLMLMAGVSYSYSHFIQLITIEFYQDIMVDTTVHTTEVTGAGENKIPTNTNVFSKYFSSNNNVVAPVVMVIW